MSDHVPQSLLAEFNELIEKSMALSCHGDRLADLEQKLIAAATEFGFASPEKFVHWLQTANLTSTQQEILAGHLTVSETYFWREPRLFDALIANIIPDLVRSRKDMGKNLRIWSAGCSTGEEAYSLAVAIRHSLPSLHEWNITILATDLNARSLQKATRGVYSEWSFRNTPEWFRTRYFKTLAKGKFEIIPEIKKMVRFAHLNLAVDEFPSPYNDTHAMDIILCRNVLMYFSPERINEITTRFFRALAEDGYFVISASEHSINMSSGFVPCNILEAIVYRKNSADNSQFKRLQAEKFLPLPPALFPEPAQKYEPKLSPEPLNQQPAPVVQPEPSVTRAVDSAAEREALYAAIIGDKDDNDGAGVPAQVKKIMLLADQGNLDDALLACNKALLQYKLDSGLYFLRATILQEKALFDDAIDSLKRALYLNPDFFMGHFAMGNLMLRTGRNKAARKHFENALVLLAKFNQDEILSDTDGLTAGRLREIIYATLHSGENR